MLLPYGDVNPTDKTPFFTWLFIGLNVFVFLSVILILLPHAESNQTILKEWLKWANNQTGCVSAWKRGGMNARKLFLLNYGLVPNIQSPVTFITSMFLHGGFMHLGGNMLYLYITGDNIEDRFGHTGFVLLYFICGLSATIFQIGAAPESCTPMVGASGAISGLLGAYLVLFPKSRIKVIFFFIFIGRTHISALFYIGFWFVMQVFSADSGGGGGVAYHAHIGGFLAGATIAYILNKKGMVKGGVKKKYWNLPRNRF